MPIDLYSSIKKTSQWAFGSPVLNGILGSSIFVSIAIALLMCLLIMIMYPAKSGTPFSIVAKMFVYMTFGSLLIIFLHDGVLKYMLEEEEEAKQAEYFMQNTTMEGRVADPAYGAMYKTISPTSQPINSQSVSQPVSQPVQQDTILGGGVLGGRHPPPKRPNPYQ
jgi:hypothetical protein